MLKNFLMTFTPDYWDKLPGRAAIGGMGALMVFVAYAMTAWGWVPLLSGTTLLIHEAGHPIIGLILGDRIMVYGGTIFQLIFPLIFAWYFAKQSQALGYCFSWIWEASSLKNVGVYANDARAQELPLVGNGDRVHDWNDILGRWGLLNWDHFIGNFFSLLSWAILMVAIYVLTKLWLAQYHALD